MVSYRLHELVVEINLHELEAVVNLLFLPFFTISLIIKSTPKSKNAEKAKNRIEHWLPYNFDQ